MSAPAPQRKPLIPSSAVKILGIAFAIGLLLFLLLWLDQRNDTDFFKGGPGGADVQVDALPAPLPPDIAGADDNASGLRLPGGETPVATRRVEPVEQPRIINEPAAPVAVPVPAPAPARTAADRAIPVPTSRPAPRYPREALRRNQGGTVRVTATVAADGSVERLQLAEGSGNRHLDRAALEAVRRWRFQPATRGGQPVSGEVVIPIVFDPQG